MPDTVHLSCQGKLTARFHFLFAAFRVCYYTDQSTRFVMTADIEFCQATISFHGKHEWLLLAGMMLFQMAFAHPSIAADDLLRSRRTGCTLLRKGLVLGRNPCQGMSLKRHENSVARIVTGCFLFRKYESMEAWFSRQSPTVHIDEGK